eukprot:SAG11_NODE_598_length_8269_cov_17.002448_7_plen_68_part_00
MSLIPMYLEGTPQAKKCAQIQFGVPSPPKEPPPPLEGLPVDNCDDIDAELKQVDDIDLTELAGSLSS